MNKLTTQNIKDKIINSKIKFGYVYGIPEGGYHIAYLIEALGLGVIVDNPKYANYIVDDIQDSGETLKKWKEKYPNKKFWVPIIKDLNNPKWIEFPWEVDRQKSGEDIVRRMIEFIGENPNREGLLETPKRVVKSWNELYSGYKQNPKDLFKIFKSDSDQMVVVKNIEFYSQCEHHLITFSGICHIAYIPNGNVVGLSKLARLVDIYARRLQIQENMTQQIAKDIMKYIPKCLGVGVVIEGKHFCMCGRGVGKQNSSMVTSALLGNFKKQEVRNEFLNLIKN